jgi:hypothetical protein
MPPSSEVAGHGAPRARVIPSYVEGWRRVLGAPWVAGGLLLLTFLAALPAAAVVGRAIESQLGSSRAAERAAAGWDAPWAAEFGASAHGAARTFTHEILGFGATLAIVSDFLDGATLEPAIVWTIAAYLLAWTFVAGGVIDRLARGRPVRAAAFFATCGVYFLRFLRLGVVIGAAYWALFEWLHPWLFNRMYGTWTRDLTSEREAALLRAGLYLVFLAALTAVAIVSDYAKTRAVVEDRHSMFGALSAALRFVRRRWLRVLALYLLNVAGAALVFAIWALIAPSADAPVWLAVLLAQIYLLLRLWTKLVFLGSATVFLQGELAHAHYTAAPLPVWPDSPAADAIR